MNPVTIKKLCECPALLELAAAWFHQKWSIPLGTYLDSMRQCIAQGAGVPQWYVALNERQEIIAGAGVIENDFHDRPDLTPNLCALFVEEPYRGQGIARRLLEFGREDCGRNGVERLYLVTDHTDFYEKCGWTFLATVHDRAGEPERMYTAPAL